MYSADRQQFSVQLSESLDSYGYSSSRTRDRIRNWKKMSDAKTIAARKLLENDEIEKLHVGSQGEGITLENESDTDILQVDHSVLCVENVEESIDANKLVFYLDQSMAPPGYTYLRLIEQSGNQVANMKNLGLKAFFQDCDQMFLSSKLYLSENKGIPCTSMGYISRNIIYHPAQGPSIPRNVRDIVSKFHDWWFASMLNDDTDLVQGFPCLCPGILQAWSARPRTSNWPSQKLMQHVQSSQGYVVPVGSKGSYKEHLQWRICFTLAEMYLVQSFNDTQRKVLVLLRHIAKHLLKPICPSITSYIIKNFMFWVAEKTPVEQYRPHLLLDRLDDALIFLKSCISKKSLPNYMIQERDLLQGKLSDKEQKALIQKISSLTEKIVRLSLMGSEAALGFCNHTDIIAGEVIGLLTTKQMANYIERSLSCKNSVMFYMYHYYHIVLPYIWKYKWRMLRRAISGLKRRFLNELIYLQRPLGGMAYNSQSYTSSFFIVFMTVAVLVSSLWNEGICIPFLGPMFWVVCFAFAVLGIYFILQQL